MTRRTFGLTVLPAIALTAAMAGGVLAASANGRYKKQADKCLWDANDSGPDQCVPVTPGRFTKSGNACVWDASGKGADLCTPTKGRFKKDGSACVWNATDSGPNQCDPRKAR